MAENNRLYSGLLLLGILGLCPLRLFAEETKKKIPPFDFTRAIDMEGYVQRTRGGQGAQTFRLRSRYLDPDVNAFVGLVTGYHHFNENVALGDPINADISSFLWNWGGNIGIIRGRHLWEIDLMGASMKSHLAPAIALVGEHYLFYHLYLFHRTEGNAFVGDLIMDADQGLYWRSGLVGVSVGYRFFAGRHMNRTGPHVGLMMRFQTPKIPFWFPSLG